MNSIKFKYAVKAAFVAAAMLAAPAAVALAPAPSADAAAGTSVLMPGEQLHANAAALARQHRRCGPMRGHGTMPAPPPGMAATVNVLVGDDCVARVSALRLVPLTNVPDGGGKARSQATSASPRATAARTVWGAQHGVYQRVWDCCGILMNEFDTIAYWQYNSSAVTYWSLHNAVAYHRETWGGWSLQYQNAWLQGSNGYQVNLAGDAGFSYQGIFDPTGNLFYNSYFNAIQVRGNGSWSCQWSYEWRNGAPGWHVQNWCG